MKYNTYKKKPTKFKRKQRNIEKGVFIITLFLMMFANMGYNLFLNNKVDNVITEVKETKQIDDLEIIAVPVITDEPDIELQIRAIADEKDFKWPDYLVRLAFCESRLDPMALNTKGNTPADSYDRGLFQYNSYWQKQISDECAYDVRCATETTIRMINEGKQHLWSCDRIVKHKK